jgi:peroxiredoxin
MLKVGGYVPNISGKDSGGQTMDLDEFRDRVVLLVFWASWCPHCRELYDPLRALVAHFTDKPFTLLGVSGDGDVSAMHMTTDRLGFRSWVEPARGAIYTAWGADGYPSLYLIERGTLVEIDPEMASLTGTIEALL